MGRKKITRYAFNEKNPIESRLKEVCRLFDLEAAAQSLERINKISTSLKEDHYQFFERLLDEELQRREDMRLDRWTKQAKFPWTKTILDYDFSYPEFVEKDKVLELAECKWIEHGGKVIFFGPPGVGKTHLSIALGIEAIQKSYETKFFTVDRLTEAISVAVAKDQEQGGGKNRAKLLNSLTNVPLLVLDELAYSTLTDDVKDFLFHIIHRRHDAQKSIILTANESFEKWDKFFGDKARTSAAIDRLLDDCVPISIKGNSYRQLHFNSKIKSNEKINKKNK
jgi:DNA replication protein DnaC